MTEHGLIMEALLVLVRANQRVTAPRDYALSQQALRDIEEKLTVAIESQKEN